MSGQWFARAPGKLFLLGEYAVLDGCPAVVAAVDRYVDVVVYPREAATLRIEATGYADPAEWPLDELPEASAYVFVLAAYRTVLARAPELAGRGLGLLITSQLVGGERSKVGLGSSAAVTVAAVASLLRAAGRLASREEIFEVALAAHRAAQGGEGSGADVAASVYGGLVEFVPRASGVPAVRSLPFPSDLELLVAWTGEASATVGLVRRYRALANGRSEARSRFVAASAAAVRGFVTALDRGGLSLASLDANAAALEELGTVLGGGVVTPALARLVALAHVHGISAKSSGAGGGDCGVALTRDHAGAERLRAAWRAAGLLPLDLHISRTGVSHGRR